MSTVFELVHSNSRPSLRELNLLRAPHFMWVCANQQRRILVRKSTIYLFVLGLAVVGMTAIASAGLVASAQNNSSMAMPNANTGMMKHKPRKPKPKSTWTGRCDPTKQEQADLTGDYTGKVNYPDASLTGDATLTIKGNDFTLTAGSTTQSGRVTAVTTCGYTGATMMFGDLTPPTPSRNPPAALPAVSLRVRKMGKRVTLMTVPGEKRSFSFATAGAKAKPRKHKSKGKAKTGAAAPTTSPATPPTTTAKKPAKGKSKDKAKPGNKNMKMD